MPMLICQGQSYEKVLDLQAVGCFFRGVNFWIGINLPKRILKRRKRATTLSCNNPFIYEINKNYALMPLCLIPLTVR